MYRQRSRKEEVKHWLYGCLGQQAIKFWVFHAISLNHLIFLYWWSHVYDLEGLFTSFFTLLHWFKSVWSHITRLSSCLLTVLYKFQWQFCLFIEKCPSHELWWAQLHGRNNLTCIIWWLTPFCSRTSAKWLLICRKDSEFGEDIEVFQGDLMG